MGKADHRFCAATAAAVAALRCLALPLMALLFMARPAASADSACQRPVTVPVSPMGMDIIIKEGTQEVSGVMPELLAELTRRTGCRFRYVHVPRVRANVLFLNGEVGMLTTASQTDERDKVGDFIHMLDDQGGVVGLKGQIERAGLPGSLFTGSYTVNVVRGFVYSPSYQQAVEQLRQQNRLEDVVDPDTLMRKMAAGRASYALVSPHNLIEAARRHGLESRLAMVLVDAMPRSRAGIYLSRSALNEAERGALSKALLEIRREQWHWKLVQKSLPAWVLEGVRPVE